jgi:hypothetical protein
VCHSVITVAHSAEHLEVPVAVAAWQPRTGGPAVADFARRCVLACHVERVERAKNLLWACAQLATFAEGVGLELEPAVVLSEAVLERFIVAGASPDPASTDTTRGWCRLMGLSANTLLLACAVVVRNVRVLDSFEARQLDDDRRSQAGIPPRRRRRRRRTIDDLLAPAAVG